MSHLLSYSAHKCEKCGKFLDYSSGDDLCRCKECVNELKMEEERQDKRCKECKEQEMEAELMSDLESGRSMAIHFDYNLREVLKSLKQRYGNLEQYEKIDISLDPVKIHLEDIKFSNYVIITEIGRLLSKFKLEYFKSSGEDKIILKYRRDMSEE